MLTLDQLRSKLVQRFDLLLLGSQTLLKVFVLLDQGLHAVQRVTEVVVGQEGLLLGHPRVRLLRVAVEELQVHALLVQDAAFFPEGQEGRLLVGEEDELLLDFFAREVLLVEQLLSGLGGRAEAILPRVNFTLITNDRFTAFKTSDKNALTCSSLFPG